MNEDQKSFRLRRILRELISSGKIRSETTNDGFCPGGVISKVIKVGGVERRTHRIEWIHWKYLLTVDDNQGENQADGGM
jgi:hypothetical protein